MSNVHVTDLAFGWGWGGVGRGGVAWGRGWASVREGVCNGKVVEIAGCIEAIVDLCARMGISFALFLMACLT